MTKHAIPVVVCEFHQEVIQFIHRNIAMKRLPFRGISMVHFDSHPDLAFPRNLCAEDCFNKEKMYNDLDIADWILPLAYAGHLNRLIWVKPPWAKQIDDAMLKVDVGEEVETGKLRINCKEDYFLEDCMYAPSRQLRRNKSITLLIAELEPLIRKCIPQSKYFHNKQDNQEENLISETSKEVKNDDEPNSKKPKCNKSDNTCNVEINYTRSNYKQCDIASPKFDHGVGTSTNQSLSFMQPVLTSADKFILDIDLDFFSVTNPFLQDYTEAEYEKLKFIYNFKFPLEKNDDEVLAKSVSEARRRFEGLETTVKQFSESCVIETKENQEFIELLKEIKQRKGKYIDWELVHHAGMTTDLPHHISTDEEIDDLIRHMVTLLKTLPVPTLVTIARSTVDEYCPPSQVESIQTKVITSLQNLYQNIEVTYDYLDDSRLQLTTQETDKGKP